MIYLLILTHWLADFVAQTDGMAKNKSKSNAWLSLHIVTYTSVLSIFCYYLSSTYPSIHPNYLVSFLAINGAAHFCIDYVTSRITSNLWKKGSVHNFFVVIGFDQALHMITLLGTYTMFFGSCL